MQDYIQAYRTTGRPPQPLPQQPTDPVERARMGLPPLFEPFAEVGGVPTRLDKDTLARIRSMDCGQEEPPPVTDLTALPEVQMFAPTTEMGETGLPQYMQSIVAQDQYRGFSFEVSSAVSCKYCRGLPRRRNYAIGRIGSARSTCRKL